MSSDDTINTPQTVQVSQIKNFAELLRFKKANNLTVICFCVPADPSSSAFINSLGSAGGLLLAENKSVGVGIMDVDATTDDVCTPFKIKAMPTTVFFRDARETARVEGCDMPKLRTTVTAHLISAAKNDQPQGDDATKKKSSSNDDATTVAEFSFQDEETKKQLREIKIVNCYFGNLNSGNFSDVTDKVREILNSSGFVKSSIVAANKEFLGCTSLENTEDNKLRIVVDRNGQGKTFSINEGKQLDLLKALSYHMLEHAGRDVYDERELKDANGEQDFDGVMNGYGALPQIPKQPEGGCGRVSR